MTKPTHLSNEYSVDDDGHVYGKKGRQLKPSKNIHGYHIVNLMIDGKRKGASVHQLVANAFIPNPEGKEQVNHIDGNPLNNAVSNLEWVTQEENMRHAITQLGFIPSLTLRKPVIASNDKEEIRFESMHAAGRWINENYGVKHGEQEVWRALNGRRRSARGYKWRYIC